MVVCLALRFRTSDGAVFVKMSAILRFMYEISDLLDTSFGYFRSSCDR
jgi:hypothetical protein